MFDGYKSTHPDFPCGIFTGCSIALSKKGKDVDFAIPLLESYDSKRKVRLRSVGACSCNLCTVAKSDGLNVLQLSLTKSELGRQHQSLVLVI